MIRSSRWIVKCWLSTVELLAPAQVSMPQHIMCRDPGTMHIKSKTMHIKSKMMRITFDRSTPFLPELHKCGLRERYKGRNC